MTGPVTRCRRRRSVAEAQHHLAEARRHLAEAAYALTDVRQSGEQGALGRSVDWQEGLPGARHQAAADELREAILRLHLFALPSLEGLG